MQNPQMKLAFDLQSALAHLAERDEVLRRPDSRGGGICD